MAFEPAFDFATRLGALAASLTLNTNLWPGEERAPKKRGRTTIIPDQAVFCLENGGRPIGMVGSAPGADEKDEHWSRIEVIIRSKRNQFTTGKALALEVKRAAHKMAVVAVDGGAAYIDCLAIGSGPTYLVDDDTEHHRWLWEFELAFEE